jgi:hypothetical protein
MVIRPYIRRYHQNPMHVIRHDHERIQHDVRIVRGNGTPAARHRQPGRVQLHSVVDYTSEQTLMPAGADRHEVRPRLRIIIRKPPNRPITMMSFRFHYRDRPEGTEGAWRNRIVSIPKQRDHMRNRREK